MSADPLDRELVAATVRTVLGRVLGVPPETLTDVKGSRDFERWDSLNMVIALVGLERRLDRRIEPAWVLRAASVGALIDRLCDGADGDR